MENDTIPNACVTEEDAAIASVREETETSGSGCCCSGKTKQRGEQEEKDLVHRLSRIEGQVRGIKKMVEEDRYCVDILTQVSAVQSALNSFNKCLLSNHIKSCVVDNIKDGREEVVDELCDTIHKLMK